MGARIVKWEDEFNTGDSMIDEQHQQIFVYINMLYQALNTQKDIQEIKDILKGLSDYSIYHFKLEEDKMRESSYPKYESHVEEHKIFIDRLYILTSDMDQKNKSINLRLFNFLKVWFSGHILNTDKKLVNYLMENK